MPGCLQSLCVKREDHAAVLLCLSFPGDGLRVPPAIGGAEMHAIVQTHYGRFLPVIFAGMVKPGGKRLGFELRTEERACFVPTKRCAPHKGHLGGSFMPALEEKLLQAHISREQHT